MQKYVDVIYITPSRNMFRHYVIIRGLNQYIKKEL